MIHMITGQDAIYGDFPYSLEIHKLTGTVSAHSHNFVEFTYVFRGRGREKINGVQRELAVGTFTLLLPHQVHELAVDGDTLSLYVGGIGLKGLFTTDAFDHSLYRLISGWAETGSPSFTLLGENAGRMLEILRCMHDEIRVEAGWSRLLFKSKLAEMFVLADRCRQSAAASAGADAASYAVPAVGSRKTGILDVVQYVYRHFREDNLTLAALADRFYLSVPHISSAFKQAIGEHFHDFLQHLRLSHACGLLESSESPMTEIAFESGFRSYGTFSRAFHAKYRITPTAYRKSRKVREGLSTETSGRA